MIRIIIIDINLSHIIMRFQRAFHNRGHTFMLLHIINEKEESNDDSTDVGAQLPERFPI